jgi:hypothetical protein
MLAHMYPLALTMSWLTTIFLLRELQRIATSRSQSRRGHSFCPAQGSEIGSHPTGTGHETGPRNLCRSTFVLTASQFFVRGRIQLPWLGKCWYDAPIHIHPWLRTAIVSRETVPRPEREETSTSAVGLRPQLAPAFIHSWEHHSPRLVTFNKVFQDNIRPPCVIPERILLLSMAPFTAATSEMMR